VVFGRLYSVIDRGHEIYRNTRAGLSSSKVFLSFCFQEIEKYPFFCICFDRFDVVPNENELAFWLSYFYEVCMLNIHSVVSPFVILCIINVVVIIFLYLLFPHLFLAN